MEKWYIYFNIIGFAVIIWFLLAYVWPHEKTDVKKINNYFYQIKHNKDCLNYLQTVTAMPTWRISLLSAAIFTLIELVLYIVAGVRFDQPIHYLAFWILYILNFLFLYKSISTILWHYVCSDGCSQDWANYS